MQKVVTTYYLEMTDRSWFNPKEGFKDKLDIKPISADVFQHWMLFVGVGLPWRWYSRLKWTVDKWKAYFSENDSRTYLAFSKEQLVGYFELVFQANKEVEIRFFGLFPSCIGSGYGGALLSYAVEIAWNSDANRVWLHTCTSDHDAALSNYLARGFKILNQKEETEEIPDKEEYLRLVNSFLDQYIETQNSSW